MRVIYRFGKRDRLRFVSHLDLQRYMQRALNRTGLPVAYTLGFNPHPVMSFASALAMGWESEYEVFDVKLTRRVPLNEAVARMRASLPEEMPVLEAKTADDSHPAMMSLVKMAEYRITPAERLEELKAGAREFLFSESVPAIRKTKTSEREIDIRPLCVRLTSEGDALIARTMLTENDTLKPDLLMSKLAELAGIELPRVRIERTLLLGAGADGKIRPLMEL